SDARMPALLPPPMPLFSCSTTRTSGKRSRTSSSVPSVEPWSTTTTTFPRTDSRHCSSHGSAFHVTTTTETSDGSMRDGRAAAEHVLPQQEPHPGQREQDRHHEEEEAARERGVARDAELPQEADEEGFAHADAVDRERHEHHEEEQRAEDDVRQEREVDADGAARGVDRDNARQLSRGGHERDDEQRPRVLAVAVEAVVDGARRGLDAEPAGERDEEREPAPDRTREEDEADGHGCNDEERLDPEVRTDRVAAEREQEPDTCEHERDRPAERALEQHGARHRRDVPPVPAARLEDPPRVATHRRRQHLAERVGDEVGARQPRDAVVDAARREQPLPAPRHRRHGDERERGGQDEPRNAGGADHVRRLAEVDLREDVRDRKRRDEQRRTDAERAFHPARRACTRRNAATASRTSSSECAGEKGSESTSAPARSVTGNGG